MRNFIAIAGIAVSSAASAQTTVDVDLAGVNFNGPAGAAGNEVINVNLAANAEVIGVGWDLSLEAFDPSWQSEATIQLEDSAQSTGVFLTPGVGFDEPGANAFSSGGVLDLVGLDLNFFVGADGNLRIEFSDSFDDGFAPQATISQGTLTIQYIPAPASAALLGLGGLAAVRRRR